MKIIFEVLIIILLFALPNFLFAQNDISLEGPEIVCAGSCEWYSVYESNELTTIQDWTWTINGPATLTDSIGGNQEEICFWGPGTVLINSF